MPAREKILHKVFYNWDQVPFYLWVIEPLLKLCKFQKYYEQDCLNCLLLQKWFKCLNIALFQLTLSKFIKKVKTNQYQKFSKDNFWPKRNMPNSVRQHLDFFATPLSCFCCKGFRKPLKLLKMSKCWSLREVMTNSTGDQVQIAFGKN